MGSTAPFMVMENAHLVQRNAGEERAHVIDAVDGDASMPTSPATRG